MDEDESRMVGNYMLVEVIGEGSFSEVSARPRPGPREIRAREKLKPEKKGWRLS